MKISLAVVLYNELESKEIVERETNLDVVAIVWVVYN